MCVCVRQKNTSDLSMRLNCDLSILYEKKNSSSSSTTLNQRGKIYRHFVSWFGFEILHLQLLNRCVARSHNGELEYKMNMLSCSHILHDDKSLNVSVHTAVFDTAVAQHAHRFYSHANNIKCN